MGWALVFLMHFIKTSGDADTLSTLQTKLDVSTNESSISVEKTEIDPSNENEYFSEDLERLTHKHDEEDELYRTPSSLPVDAHEDAEWEKDYIGGDADAEWARSAMMQQSISDEEADAEQFAASFQRMIDESMGDDGEEVVLRAGSYEASQAPCVNENKYLHETFVHADYTKSSYICKPCHITCSGKCKGPDAEDCLLDSEVKKQPRRNKKATASFVASFEKVMRSRSENTVALMDLSELSDVNQTSCEVVSSVPVSANTSFYGDTTANLQLVVDEVGAENQLIDSTTLKGFAQDAIQDENERNGFFPGVSENVNTAQVEEVSVTRVVEDGTVASSAQGAKAVTQPVALAVKEVVQKSCEDEEEEQKAVERELDRTKEADEKFHGTLGRRSRSARRRYTTRKNQMVTNSKQSNKARRRRRRPPARRRRRRRQKRRRRSKKDEEEEDENEEETEWLLNGEGECVDAVTKLVETAQEMYDCYKSNFARLKQVFCEPAEKHMKLKKGMEAIMVSSHIIEVITKPLKPIPYVGPVAKVLWGVALATRRVITPKVRFMRSLRVAQYGTFWENSDCCPPKAKSADCVKWPGATYRCGSCSQGSMCQAARACNTLTKLEEKIDTWKEETYDPYIEYLTEAAAHHQGVYNIANGLILQRCGINACGEALKIATFIEAQVKFYFLDRFCPIPVPSVSIPSFDLGVVNFLVKIGNVFGKIKLALGKLYCMYVPQAQAWWQRVCTRICHPCCGWARRRRWAGHPYCNWCCHHVCVPVLRMRFYMKRFCFSAMRILQGLGAIFRAVLGPILAIIDRIINALLAPIRALVNAILNKLGFNVNFGINPWPSLPDIRLPNLPRMWPDLDWHGYYFNLNCNALKNLAVRHVTQRVGAVSL